MPVIIHRTSFMARSTRSSISQSLRKFILHVMMQTSSNDDDKYMYTTKDSGIIRLNCKFISKNINKLRCICRQKIEDCGYTYKQNDPVSGLDEFVQDDWIPPD
jgi:hypothetical protein